MTLAGYDFIKIAPQFFVNLIYMLLSFNSLFGLGASRASHDQRE